VDEQKIPEAGRPQTGRALTSVGVVLAAAALAVAGFVVVRSFRDVKPEPLPPSLRTAPPDSVFFAFRTSMRRKAMGLSARCQSERRRLGDGMTPSQESLGRECDSAISMVRLRITVVDTVAKGNRKAATDSVKAEYERAKLKVRAFTHTVLSSDTIAEDSLNREIKKLISE
jgi:hypothetical protein